MVFTIHWHESATGVHVSPCPELPPPPSPSHSSGLSQCTGFECPVSCIELGLVIYFTYGNVHVSVLFSQITFKRWIEWYANSFNKVIERERGTLPATAYRKSSLLRHSRSLLKREMSKFSVTIWPMQWHNWEGSNQWWHGIEHIQDLRSMGGRGSWLLGHSGLRVSPAPQFTGLLFLPSPLWESLGSFWG